MKSFKKFFKEDPETENKLQRMRSYIASQPLPSTPGLKDDPSSFLDPIPRTGGMAAPSTTPKTDIHTTLSNYVNKIDQPRRDVINKSVDAARISGKFGSSESPQASKGDIMSHLKSDTNLQKQYPGVGHDHHDPFAELSHQREISKHISANHDEIVKGGYRDFNHKEGPSSLTNATLAVTHMDHPELRGFQKSFYDKLANHSDPSISKHPYTTNLGNRVAVNQSKYWDNPNAGKDLKTVPRGLDNSGKLSTEIGSQGHRYLGTFNHKPPKVD